MYLSINAPGHGKSVVYGINATYKRYLKGKMELIGKLASKYTSKIGMFLSDPQDVFNENTDKYIHILSIMYIKIFK